jgi:predicted Zn-dependent protease
VRRARGCCACLLVGLLITGCSTHRFARKSARETAEQLASQARAASDRGDAATAEYFLTAAVNTTPRDCEFRLELSELLMEHGSPEAATEHLRQVVALHPEDPRGYVRLARARYLQNDGAEAGQLVDKALELDPENPQAWLLRARLERDHQSDSRALAACYRVLTATPDQPDAQLLAAEIHLKNGNHEQASPLLRSLLDNASECPIQRASASRLLGRCYALEGRWGEAADALSAGLNDEHGSADDWYQVAYARYRSGDLDAAQLAVERALRLSPTNKEALLLSRDIAAKAVRTASAADDEARADVEWSQASTNRVVPAAAIVPAP